MPVTSKGRLLTRLGAVLAAGVACTGCQTASIRHDAYAVRPGPAPSRPLLGLFHRSAPTTEEPPVAAKAAASVTARGAMPTAPGGQSVSAWLPVQRTSAEIPVDAASDVVRASRFPPAFAPAPPATLATPTLRSKGDVGEPISPPKELGQPRLEPQAVVIAPAVHQLDSPRECAKRPLPPYTAEPPDILLIEIDPAITKSFQTIGGSHLVRPDGTVNLGGYGSVYVAGMTLDEIREAIVPKIQAVLDKVDAKQIRNNLNVDVIAYNSKVYYVITDGGGYGEQVYPIPITGNETVLDAIGKINGLPAVASKKRVTLARACQGDAFHPDVLPVDWCAIASRADPTTNYQLFPGDRVYVNSDKRIIAESFLNKWLNPVDRVLSSTLLGSSTYNSIRNRTGTGSGSGF
jgi:polysaccharide export outer membrane protein